jgi:hypothetical protein
MNNQTHPILPNSNGTRTEPPKNAGPPARIKRRRRRCASNWKRADPRDRDEFKKKKKKFGQDRKEKRQDPPHAILKIQLEIEPSCFFKWDPMAYFLPVGSFRTRALITVMEDKKEKDPRSRTTEKRCCHRLGETNVRASSSFLFLAPVVVVVVVVSCS